MVCLGNICRSPMAQGIMEKLVKDRGLDWVIDSAGTNGMHNGESPDKRAIEEARNRGIDISQQRSRKIRKSDLEYFDIIFSMDNRVLKECFKVFGDRSDKNIKCIMSFVNSNEEVEDPYYDGSFKKAFDKIEAGCQAMISQFS